MVILLLKRILKERSGSGIRYNLHVTIMNLYNKNPNTRIVINTFILYFQLVFTILVNLYSTRLILNAMGVEDFGIVNLVSGIVAMLSFFQNSLTISTQRFLSVNMGRNDENKQIQIFNTSVVIHLILGILLVAILESVTPLIFNSSIQIPIERLNASQLLYQLTILGTFFVIISVPFDATLNAHENMLVYSISCIMESAIRLGGAIILIGYNNDKLVFYGLLLITIRLVSLMFKFLYCRFKYVDAKIDFAKFNKSSLKQMLSFAGWNLIGGFAVSLRSQGMAIVLNIFQGVIINAAYGIANQVAGQLSNFTATLTKAMAPQIMQSKGSGDEDHMMRLSLKQCRYSFLLLLFFVIPLYVCMPTVLRLWLKQIPEYGVSFCRLILLVSMAQQVTIGMQTLIQANGKIALYQTIMSFLIMLNVPCAYIVLYLGYNANLVIIAMLLVEIVCMIGRLVLANKLVGLDYKIIGKELLFHVTILTVSAIAITVACLSLQYRLNEYISLLLTIIISWSSLSVIAIMTFSNSEKAMFKQLLFKIQSILKK